MPEEKTVVAFGEILWDILPNATVLGGAPFNFTYRIHTLGDRGIILSRLGNDKLGKRARETAESLGMDMSCIQTDDSFPTGTVEVGLDENSNPDFYIVPCVAYDHIEMSEALIASVEAADCICFGTLVQRSEQSRKTLVRLPEKAPKAMKFLDINLRKECYSAETIAGSLEAADILKLNDDEVFRVAELTGIAVSSIPGFCANAMERWNLGSCLVTLGRYGVFAASNTGEKVYLPGYEVEVVDTVGSGDAFSAGFVHEKLRGATLEAACSTGNVLGALVAARRGATSPVSREEIGGFRRRTGVPRIVHPDFAKMM